MKNTAKTTLFLILMLSLAVGSASASDSGMIGVEWYGHSCYLLTLKSGAKILTDPFNIEWMPYQFPQCNVDVVFSTHDHFDHNAVDAVTSDIILLPTGSDATFSGASYGVEFSGADTLSFNLNGADVTFTTVPSFHDQRNGELRGVNGIVRFEAEGIIFVHLGDLGVKLTEGQVQQLTPVDVVMIPVGGFYTIDAETAERVVVELNPKIVLPMHYKTEVLPEDFPISGIEPFIEGKAGVQHIGSSSFLLKSDELPNTPTIIILKYHGQN